MLYAFTSAMALLYVLYGTSLPAGQQVAIVIGLWFLLLIALMRTKYGRR
jgi:hypothetical protein